MEAKPISASQLLRPGLRSDFDAQVCYPVKPVAPAPPPMIDPRPKGNRINRKYYSADFVQRMQDEAGIDPLYAAPVERYARYWIARRYCGWNAMSASLRDLGPDADGGRVLSDPMDTSFWSWLKFLTTNQLDKIVELSFVGPCPGCERISAHSPGRRVGAVEKRSKAILGIFLSLGETIACVENAA